MVFNSYSLGRNILSVNYRYITCMHGILETKLDMLGTLYHLYKKINFLVETFMQTASPFYCGRRIYFNSQTNLNFSVSVRNDQLACIFLKNMPCYLNVLEPFNPPLEGWCTENVYIRKSGPCQKLSSAKNGSNAHTSSYTLSFLFLFPLFICWCRSYNGSSTPTPTPHSYSNFFWK